VPPNTAIERSLEGVPSSGTGGLLQQVIACLCPTTIDARLAQSREA
jgi:hypothetical protein